MKYEASKFYKTRFYQRIWVNLINDKTTRPILYGEAICGKMEPNPAKNTESDYPGEPLPFEFVEEQNEYITRLIGLRHPARGESASHSD